MPGVDPALRGVVTYRKHERPKVLARPARLGVTDDHYLLLMHGLELEPLARSLTRVVESRCALGDHALFMRSLRLDKLPPAKLGDVLAIVQQRIARHESFQNLLAFKQRFFADVLATHK